MMRGKKGIVDPFDIGSRIGYYIIFAMIISVVFLFLSVLIGSSEITFYKSNHGTNIINLEEKTFNFIEYRDPVTDMKYSKVIDVEKFLTSKINLDTAIGVPDQYAHKGVKVELFDEHKKPIGNTLMTTNFVDGRSDFIKSYPVMIAQTNNNQIIFVNGQIKIYFWKP